MASDTKALEPLLGATDVASIAGVPVSTVYAWRYKGTGPQGFRVGKRLRFKRSDVEAWLDQLIRAERSEGPADPVALAPKRSTAASRSRAP